MLDISANLLFLKTNRRHRIPSCPEAFPMKVSLSSPKLASNGNGTLALDIPNHFSHRIFRRNPDEHVDMVLHHMPFQLAQHRTKKAPNLAIQRLLPSLRDKDHVIFTIPL